MTLLPGFSTCEAPGVCWTLPIIAPILSEEELGTLRSSFSFSPFLGLKGCISSGPSFLRSIFIILAALLFEQSGESGT